MASKATAQRKKEWRAIQIQLRKALKKYGKNAKKGGDFWLIDKDDNTLVHKIILYNTSALVPETIDDLHEALWEVLEDSPNDKWEVHVLWINSEGSLQKPHRGLKIT